MAYLIAVANPLDELALRRILNTPKRGIGPATETALASFAEQNELTFRQAMRAADGLGLGPKVTGAIPTLADRARRGGRHAGAIGRGRRRRHERWPRGLRRARSCSSAPACIDALRDSRDPQDEARAENVEELVAQTKDFDREQPRRTLSTSSPRCRSSPPPTSSTTRRAPSRS